MVHSNTGNKPYIGWVCPLLHNCSPCPLEHAQKKKKNKRTEESKQIAKTWSMSEQDVCSKCELRQLSTNGRTDIIKGFVSRSFSQLAGIERWIYELCTICWRNDVGCYAPAASQTLHSFSCILLIFKTAARLDSPFVDCHVQYDWFSMRLQICKVAVKHLKWAYGFRLIPSIAFNVCRNENWKREILKEYYCFSHGLHKERKHAESYLPKSKYSQFCANATGSLVYGLQHVIIRAKFVEIDGGSQVAHMGCHILFCFHGYQHLPT